MITASERKPDPVLALIEDHKKANAEYGEVCREVVPGTCSPDPEKEEQYGARETEVRDDLATTVPTTLEGLLAVLTYVEAVSEGKLTAEGRHDFCPGLSRVAPWRSGSIIRSLQNSGLARRFTPAGFYLHLCCPRADG